MLISFILRIQISSEESVKCRQYFITERERRQIHKRVASVRSYALEYLLKCLAKWWRPTVVDKPATAISTIPQLPARQMVSQIVSRRYPLHSTDTLMFISSKRHTRSLASAFAGHKSCPLLSTGSNIPNTCLMAFLRPPLGQTWYTNAETGNTSSFQL